MWVLQLRSLFGFYFWFLFPSLNSRILEWWVMCIFSFQNLASNSIFIIKYSLMEPTCLVKSDSHPSISLFFFLFFFWVNYTTISSDPPSSPSFQNQEANFFNSNNTHKLLNSNNLQTNLNPKQTQPQLHKKQTGSDVCVWVLLFFFSISTVCTIISVSDP